MYESSQNVDIYKQVEEFLRNRSLEYFMHRDKNKNEDETCVVCKNSRNEKNEETGKTKEENGKGLTKCDCEISNINIIGIPPLRNQNMFFDPPHIHMQSSFLPSDEIVIYQLLSHPGAYLIPGYLDSSEEILLAAECFLNFIQPPNRTNIKEEESFLKDIWKNYVLSKDDKLFKHVRWATLGHQYDWTSRRYDECVEFPECLSVLCDEILSALDIHHFTAQAAIVNIYRKNDRLRGHKDDAENCRDSPLVSISLGLPCIFLLGGETRSQVPQPLVLRSGDVLILTGESRQFYHGVAKLLNFNSNGSSGGRVQKKKNNKKKKEKKIATETEQNRAFFDGKNENYPPAEENTCQENNLIVFKKFKRKAIHQKGKWKDKLKCLHLFENERTENLCMRDAVLYDETIKKNYVEETNKMQINNADDINVYRHIEDRNGTADDYIEKYSSVNDTENRIEQRSDVEGNDKISSFNNQMEKNIRDIRKNIFPEEENFWLQKTKNDLQNLRINLSIRQNY